MVMAIEVKRRERGSGCNRKSLGWSYNSPLRHSFGICAWKGYGALKVSLLQYISYDFFALYVYKAEGNVLIHLVNFPGQSGLPLTLSPLAYL